MIRPLEGLPWWWCRWCGLPWRSEPELGARRSLRPYQRHLRNTCPIWPTRVAELVGWPSWSARHVGARP